MGPAEEPKVAARRFTDDGPGVVLSAVENPIIADIEGAEERHLELRIAAIWDDLRLAIDCPLRARNAPLAAGVQHTDEAVIEHGVASGNAFAAPLESILV